MQILLTVIGSVTWMVDWCSARRPRCALAHVWPVAKSHVNGDGIIFVYEILSILGTTSHILTCSIRRQHNIHVTKVYNQNEITWTIEL